MSQEPRKFSRWTVLPPVPNEPGSVGWPTVGAILAVSVALLVFVRGARYALLLVVAGGAIAAWRRSVGLRRLADRRPGENIGTFARAFNRRAEPFDPRVVRAVWEELKPYVSFRGGRTPLRPSDSFDRDLRIDLEDIDMDLLAVIATRSGRSLKDIETNAWYGRVGSVGDLVRLLSAQPKEPAA